LAKSSQADPQIDDRPLPQDFETALARVCQERLAQAEQQVKVLEGDLLRPLDPAALDDE
jgi:exodeoxyribonuclease VII small subunit